MPDISEAVFPPGTTALGGGEIFIPPPPEYLEFRHRTVSGVSAEADNVDFPFYWTRLDHPALNDFPQAILTVTPVGRIEVNQATKVANLVQNPHPVGVVFRNPDDPTAGSSTGTGRWYIYNLGLEAMATRADFHVAIHQATRPE